MSKQHASVYQGRICSDNFTCCHTEIQVADQTFHLTLLQYTEAGPTSPSTDPITSGARQGSHWSANFFKVDSNSGSSALEADALTTRRGDRTTECAPCNGSPTQASKHAGQHSSDVTLRRGAT